MSLVVFGSLKGAPGVTTLAACVAYQWPRHRRVALVEADADGGAVAPRFGLHPEEPSLVTFAAASRHGVSDTEFWSACQCLPDGPAVLVAPGGESTGAALEQVDFGALDGRLQDTDLLIDAGRLRVGAPAARLRAQADFVVVVIRPRFESLAVLLDRAAGLSERTPLLAVVAGDGPYPVAEIDAALRQTTGDRAWVLGSVAADARGAAALASDAGRARALRRSLLARSARAVTDLLAHLSSAGVSAAPRSDAA
ncbi:MAG: hypothetical protein OXG47_02035 [bacterium]|nr:hypothetical protein [bacterium]MCY3925887.1 hypothetical protein [bacterium]